MLYCFGDIVVVDEIEIGVIVKLWLDKTYDIYVRQYNSITTYHEKDVKRYMVRHKYLNEEELEYQNNAINNI